MDSVDADGDIPSWGARIDAIIRNKDLIWLQTKMLLTAMGIIYLGAHAALCRPPSAAPRSPRKSKDGSKCAPKKVDEDNFAEGLNISDAIVLPIVASFTLIGLFYLLKWVDPQIVSKFIKWYFSFCSLFSLSGFLGDAAALAASFVFPNVWSDAAGTLYRFDQAGRRQMKRLSRVPAGLYYGPKYPTGQEDHPENIPEDDEEWAVDETRLLPFPDFTTTWSWLVRLRPSLWELRRFAKDHLKIEFSGRLVGGKETVDISYTRILGLFGAIVVTSVYHFTGAADVSNILGLGMSYGCFKLMSPTSFSIGTAVLAGLFVYDIVMVFYTPFMITVATTLDAPIKLTFGNAKHSSMLGLGDIVLPGIFICLCLRYDLWRHYQAKRQFSLRHTPSSDSQKSKPLAVAYKAEYVDPRGRWGDWIWTRHSSAIVTTRGLEAMRFPKTYFYTSMIGYALGLLTTVIMLYVFQHGQPALLYLVPFVTGSVWFVGWLNGELDDMWNYTEDGTLDTKDVVVDVDEKGNVIKESVPEKEETQDGKDESSGDKAVKKSGSDGNDKSKELFRFVVTSPDVDELTDFDV